MNMVRDLAALIGGSSLVKLRRVGRGASAELAVRLEGARAVGSVTDRIGVAMIDVAEQEGLIDPWRTTLVEPTSGEAGIALAFVASLRGYRVVLVMPDTVGVERRVVLRAFGAELVLTEGGKGLRGAIERAREIAAEIRDSFIPHEFRHVAEADACGEAAVEEIWRDTRGRVDALIATGDAIESIAGVAEGLKRRKVSLEVVAVEPASSPRRAAGFGGDPSRRIDRVVNVGHGDAIAATRRLVNEEGLSAGISSGAAIHAALAWAHEPENAGKLAVVVLSSHDERWLAASGFVHSRYEGSSELAW